jgi:hypothetical protein
MSDNQPRSEGQGWDSGDAGTSQDIIDLIEDNVFEPTGVVIGYDTAGSTYAEVELYDDAAGTAAGNLSNPFFETIVNPNDTVALAGFDLETVEEDVVGIIRNNDARVVVTVAGDVITP